MSYHHLTQEQHPQIQRLKSRLIGQKQIAVLIAVHPSTISRELAIKAYRVIIAIAQETRIEPSTKSGLTIF